MAIASGNFMAAPGAFTTAWSTKLDKIDCSQVLAAVLKADRAILGHIKMGSVGTNIEFNWIEDNLNSSTFEGHTLTSTSISVMGFTATTSLEDKVLRGGALVAPRDSTSAGCNDMILRVASVVNQSSLFTAMYGNTTFATCAVTCVWSVIAQPYGDSSDASADISKARTKKSNFMQIFERAVEIAQTRKGMDMEAVTDELQLQIKYRTLEIKRELNMTVLMGHAYYSGGFSGDLDARTTQGIISYIRDPDFNGTREDTLVTDEAGAALTVALINALLYKIWDAGGLDETSDPIIVVGAEQQRIIAAMEKDIRRVEQGERQVGYYRDLFLSDMGKELPIVLDRWMPKDKLLVLDRSRVALRALSGDAWHMEKMAKTGRSEKWQISGQYGLEIRNPDSCHGLLLDLS
jgi:hypothetical protein